MGSSRPPNGAAARGRLPIRAPRQRQSRNLVQPDQSSDIHGTAEYSQPDTGDDLEASRPAESVLTARDFPKWVPPSVVSTAILIDATSVPKMRGVIRRLAIDPRMKIVWAQLRARRRDRANRTGVYQYSALGARLPPTLREECELSPQEAHDEAQNRAMEQLFTTAAGATRSVLPAITKARLEEKRRPFLDMSAHMLGILE